MENFCKMNNTTQVDAKYKPANGYGQCRCCLREGNHQDILKEHIFNGTLEVYYEILKETFNLMLSKSSNLSMLICAHCITRLRDASSFRAMVTTTEQQLLDSLNEKNRSLYDDPVATSHIEVLVKTEPVTVKVESLDIYEEHFIDSELSVDFEYTSSDEVLAKVVKRREKRKPDLVDGEAELVGRFSRLRRLPTRASLHRLCPDYVRHLEDLEDADETMTPSMIWIPPEPTEVDPTPLITPFKEKAAIVSNIILLLSNSNITPFKRKIPTGYPCYYCRNVFKNFDDLKTHTQSHNKTTELPKALNSRGTGAETLIVHSDITDLKCTICNQCMPTIEEFKSHLSKMHNKKFFNEVTDRMIPFRMTGENYICVFCSSMYGSFGAIDKHMNGHFRNYVCKDCGSGYVIKGRLKKHIKNSHVIGSFPCKDCGKVFSNETKMRKHAESVHRGVKRLKCPWCEERFVEYTQRQRHLEEFHGEAKLEYKCNVCNQLFAKKYLLTCHMKQKHLDQRDFECEMCDYKSHFKKTLKEHMVKHLGEKKFVCEVCKKSYGRQKTLKEHMRIHNNDRRFVCPVCGQAFVQKCSLKGHMRSHHADYDQPI